MQENKYFLEKLEEEYQKNAAQAGLDERMRMHEKYFSYLEKQIKKNPIDIPTLLHLGILSWEPFHRQEEAIIYLEKVIAYDPKNVDARFWLAKCYYHDYCAYEKVKALLLEALEINPNRADCLALLGSLVLDSSNSLKEAIFYYEKAIKQAPNWPILRQVIAGFYLQNNDIKSAEYHAQQALAQFKPPDSPPKNFIEDYYEDVVTGRAWVSFQKSSEKLFARIEKAKNKETTTL